MAIAIVDRLGVILAVWQGPNAPATVPGNFSNMNPPIVAAASAAATAVALARTAAFFSNDQAPLSSRTVRFISGIHFPPEVANAPNAALYGIENTNRGCILSTKYLTGQEIPLTTTIHGTPDRLGILTGKADVMDGEPNGQYAVNPGGVPIFKSGHVVGGIGITGVPYDVAEYVAFQTVLTNADGIALPLPLPPPGEVLIDGIALPFVDQVTPPSDLTAPSGSFDSRQYLVMPIASNGLLPEGYLVAATDGQGGLTAAQVNSIIMNAVNAAMQTRALIRLPLGSRARMTIAVSDLDGTIIGMYRMHDGTVFSIDVAATKARNVVYFSGPNRTTCELPNTCDLPDVPINTAVTNRTIGFGAQPLFPPGINGTSPGPFFNLYIQDTANPCTQGADAPGPPGPNDVQNQSGIVFFPGSEPLYVNGVLVGGLGVSGDGVDQDDYVTAGGAVGFEAPANVRADQIIIENVRLPFLHFPRNPTQ